MITARWPGPPSTEQAAARPGARAAWPQSLSVSTARRRGCRGDSVLPVPPGRLIMTRDSGPDSSESPARGFQVHRHPSPAGGPGPGPQPGRPATGAGRPGPRGVVGDRDCGAMAWRRRSEPDRSAGGPVAPGRPRAARVAAAVGSDRDSVVTPDFPSA